jgi:hypothetical protein
MDKDKSKLEIYGKKYFLREIGTVLRYISVVNKDNVAF